MVASRTRVAERTSLRFCGPLLRPFVARGRLGDAQHEQHRDPAQDRVGPQQMPIGQGDDRAPQQRARRRPHLRRELRIAENGRSPRLLAAVREIRVVEQRHVASRDHAQRDPHREVVEEEALVAAPQRQEGKADGLERRAQQQCLLPSPQVREQPRRHFAAEDHDREHRLQLHELPHADPLRRQIGDPQGDHDHELIEEGEAVEELDVPAHWAPRAATGGSASGGPRGRAPRRRDSPASDRATGSRSRHPRRARAGGAHRCRRRTR